MSAFGTVLRRARLAAGLSQQDLAERSGVSVRQISYLESGRTRNPYRKTVRLLADALNLDAWVRAELENAARASMRMSALANGQSTAEAAAAKVPQSAATLPAPAQLPHDATEFTGRAAELAALTRLREHSSGVLPIFAIDGAAGIGKTALAVHWAHQVVSWFPDGQLYVNLRGFDASGESVAPAEAVEGFLDAFAIPTERKPVSLAARTALYRSLLAGKRMLIVLDNAHDEQQVRPLLPGNPECMVIVTSRRQLGGLVAADGATMVTLDPLSEAEARALLAGRLGEEQVAAEAQATAELVRFCAGLPLALAVTAARVATCPSLSLAELAAELHDEANRLNTLDVGDAITSVRAVFSWSYRHLNQTPARLFRLLALHPGPYITEPVVASLADTSMGEARELLGQLTQVSLLRQHGPGRFAFHDLVLAYARELVSNDDASEQQAAQSRMFDYYLHSVTIAIDVVFPAETARRPRVDPKASRHVPISDQEAALAWLDTERANLIAATRAAIHGWPGHTSRLAATLFHYLDAGGHFSEAAAIHGDARRAAARIGDRAAEAVALTNLGVAYLRRGQDELAMEYTQQAIDLHPEAADRIGHSRALYNLGVAYLRRGQDELAMEYMQQALELQRETSDRVGQVRTLSGLGSIERRHGRYEQATLLQQQALALSRDLGDRTGEAYALAYIGEIAGCEHRYGSAETHIRQALTLFREVGDRNGEAGALADLGSVDLQQGRYPQAESHLQQALILYREIGDPNGQAEVFNGLGEMFLQVGPPEKAVAQHRTALGLASQAGNKDEEARAHSGLRRAYQAAGDDGQTCQHQQRALDLYSDLGVLDADEHGQPVGLSRRCRARAAVVPAARFAHRERDAFTAAAKSRLPFAGTQDRTRSACPVSGRAASQIRDRSGQP
jgi:tetratricopeptide (TPR) repeat protein